MGLKEEIKRVHANLVIAINNETDYESSEFENFNTVLGLHLQKGILARNPKITQKLGALTMKGILGPGSYDILKSVAKDSGNETIVNLIEKAETDIEELKGQRKTSKGEGANNEKGKGAANSKTAIKKRKKEKATDDSLDKIPPHDSDTNVEHSQEDSLKTGEQEPYKKIKTNDIDELPRVRPKDAVEEELLDGNAALPFEILRLDKHSIEIYKQILKEGKEAVHNIRVMVVGHLGVGKTALTKRLLGKKIDVSTRESTNGIDVHVRRCNVSLKDGQWIMLQKDEKCKDISKRLLKLFAYQRETETTYNQLKSPDTDDTEPERAQAQVLDYVNTTDIEDATGDNDTQTDTETIILNDLKEIIKVASTSNLKDEQEFANLSIWDFAGHHAFYSTHQVFLSHRAVYLLVTDISKHINDLVDEDTCFVDSSGSKTCSVSEFIEFWLNSIHGYCPTTQPDVPPVILIGTHADLLDKMRKDELSEDYFLAMRKFLSGKVIQYHVVDEEFAIDNSIDDPTLDGLKKKILEVASQQSYWGELIPARWIMLEKALMDVMKDGGLKIIKRVDIESINRLLPVPLSSDEELQLFLRFQHDLGNILYFSDEGLRDYVLLDPQWLVDAFKCILTAERFCSKKPQIYDKWQEFNKTAKLKLDLIDAVWKKEENESFYDNRHHLIGLMEKLDIIAKPRTFNDDCSATEAVDYFFAPSALKDPPPPDILISHPKYQSTTKLCFTVSTSFIPTAIFNRLFAACLTRWQISRQKEKDLIFCGCGVFDVGDVPHTSHRLTIYFNEHVIQIWVTRYSETHPPSSTICANVKEFVEQTLRKIIDRSCPSSELEMFIKCPKIGVQSGCLYKLSDLRESEEIPCHCNQDTHVLATSEMLWHWFPEKSIQSAGGGIKVNKMMWLSLAVPLLCVIGGFSIWWTVLAVVSAIVIYGCYCYCFEYHNTEPGRDFVCKVGANIYYFTNTMLGRGSSGLVYEGRFGSRNGMKIAVKRITFQSKAEARKAQITIRNTYRETMALEHTERSRHPNIVGFYGSHTFKGELFIAFEFCDGTLCEYVQNQNWIDSFKPVNINKSMVEGLNFLHGQNIVHRDLKPSNVFILLSKKNNNIVSKIVIGDFGTAKFVPETFNTWTGQCGTMGFIAPEIWKNVTELKKGQQLESIISKKSDIFSMGILFYFTTTLGKHPYGTVEHKLQTNIENEEESNLKEIKDKDYSLCLLLKEMLATKPEKRPDTAYVCSHPALWTCKEILEYCLAKSDEFEDDIIKKDKSKSNLLEDPNIIPGGDWLVEMTNIGKSDLSNYLKQYKLGNSRKPLYLGKETSVRYLLRAMRNTEHHYQTYPAGAQKDLGSFPDGHAELWLTLCPKLLMHVYSKLGK